MTENPEKLTVYGAEWCPDVTMARAYLDRHGIPYRYRDIDKDREAKAYLERLKGKDWVVPTIGLPDGTVLHNPSIRELADRLGRPPRRRSA